MRPDLFKACSIIVFKTFFSVLDTGDFDDGSGCSVLVLGFPFPLDLSGPHNTLHMIYKYHFKFMGKILFGFGIGGA